MSLLSKAGFHILAWACPLAARVLTTLLVIAAFGLGAPVARAGSSDAQTPELSRELDESVDDELMISDVELEERESVFVATKTRKTLQEAPAIVTVLTGKDMDRLGFRTLNEALHTVPGFEHSNTSRWDFLFTRGNAFTVSVLLNGVPIVNPGDNLVFLDQAYPINIIERVEIISGPGGTLWGANAFLGVINIVTKKGADIDGMFVEAGGGSYRTGRAAIAYGKKFGDFDVMVSGNFQTTTEGQVEVRRETMVLPPDFAFPLDDVDPSEPTVYNAGGAPIFQGPGSTDPRNDYFYDIIGQISWKGFKLFGRFAQEKDYYQVSSSSGALLGEEQSFDTDPSQMVSLTYDGRVWDDRLGLHGKAYFWMQEFQVDSVVFPASETTLPNQFGIQLAIDQQRRLGAIFEADAKLPWSITALAGLEYYRAEIDGARLGFFGPNTGNLIQAGELVPDSASNVVSTYGNAEINLFERVAISGGIRFNYSDTYASTTLFSVNVVGHVLDLNAIQSYVKGSYTQGFRPPSFEQRFSTDPFFLGNQSIGPERSEAWQVELNAKVLRNVRGIEHLGVRVDVAHTRLQDLIGLLEGEDGESAQFNNTGTRRVNSVEAAAELLFRAGHRVWAGYSFNDVRDIKADEPIRNNAPHIFNMGGNVRFSRFVSMNAVYSFVAGKTINGYLDPGTVSPVALDLSAYHLLTAGFVVNDADEKYRLLVHAYNLLGQHYETVDGDTTAAPYPYPQPNSIALLARIQARF